MSVAAETDPRRPRHRHACSISTASSVSFDGFKALNDLSLVLDQGEMRAIIGPNGAGKTTMMDVITGKTRPDKGTVLFRRDIDLTRLDEAEIAKLGIGRKFQKPTVFESHTCRGQPELALKGDARSVRVAALRPSRASSASGSTRSWRTIRLERQRASALAGDSVHGQKQWLEIGMLLAQDPKLLLVDEPVAGMTDAETEQTASCCARSPTEHSVVVVEHDMDFVRDLGVKVTVLHEGSVLAEGYARSRAERPSGHRSLSGAMSHAAGRSASTSTTAPRRRCAASR